LLRGLTPVITMMSASCPWIRRESKNLANATGIYGCQGLVVLTLSPSCPKIGKDAPRQIGIMLRLKGPYFSPISEKEGQGPEPAV